MSLPKTEFEKNGGSTWTSFSQEEEYFSELLLSTTRLRRTLEGENAHGSPIYAYHIGNGKQKVFINSFVHGSEPSCREAAMIKIREWAHRQDDEFLTYLESVSIIVVPTCNPYRIGTRTNPNGVDLNRDHVGLYELETRAIHNIITKYEPNTIADFHELASTNRDIATGNSNEANTHIEVKNSSVELENYLGNYVESRGLLHRQYQGGRWEEPSVLSTNGGVRHASSILVEVCMRDSQNNSRPFTERTDNQLLCMESVIEWHISNHGQAEQARINSIASSMEDQSNVQIYAGETDSSVTVSPSPVGYILTSQSLSTLQPNITILNISVSEIGGNPYIETKQKERHIINHLLDPSSHTKKVDAIRYYGGEIPPPPNPPNPLYLGRNLKYVLIENGVRKKVAKIIK